MINSRQKYKGTIQVTGYKPYKYQKDVHDGLDRCWYGTIHVVKSKRQVGKSVLIENVLLKTACEKNRTVSMCVSPTLNQSRKIYTELVEAIQDSCVFLKKNDSLLEIKLKNQSTILFKSAEQGENLRGYTVSGILCIDEASYIKDDIFYTILPFVDVRRAPILIVSTPRFRRGFFSEYYMLGLADNRRTIFSYDINRYDTSHLLTPEKLEFYRKTLPKNQFRTEYLGEFIDADSLVFGSFQHLVGLPIDESDKNYYYGIDWGTGSGKDYTSITIMNGKNQEVYHEAFNDKDETETIRYIVNEIYTKFKPTRVLVELNSIGSIFFGLLEKESFKRGYTCQIDGFVTSNSSKTTLVNNLQVAIQNGTVNLLKDEKQIMELSMYEAKAKLQTNAVTYSAPSGYNDDSVISLLLAFDCVNTQGGYSISYV